MLKGQHFIVIDGNAIMGFGFIKDTLNDDRYLCTFEGAAPFNKIVPLEAMMEWPMFDNEPGRRRWLDMHARQAEAQQGELDIQPAPEADEPLTGGQPATAEDLGDAFDPESPLTPDEQLADLAAEESRA